MTTYTLISAIIFFVLGIAWKKSDLFNFFAKLVMIGMGLIGFFYWAQEMGYIFQIPQ